MATVNVKCADIIQQFCGTSDFGEWIRKVELVAKLQKIKELETFVPLFLSGGAFAVYENLADDVKDDYVKLKNALLRAFSSNQLCAFEEFTARRLQLNETVDVYVADLRRLVGLVNSSVPEEWIKCKVISGLSDGMKSQVVAACSLEKMTLAEVVERVRVLVNASVSNTISALSIGEPRNKGRSGGWERDGIGKSILCYQCGGSGHMSRDCPSRRRSGSCYDCGANGHIARECPRPGASGGGGRSLQCFKCTKPGHTAARCPLHVAETNVSKNESGGSL
jgi:hypothetical protein